MGLILSDISFTQQDLSEEFLENANSDTDRTVELKLKHSVEICCPYCHKKMVLCGKHIRHMRALSGSKVKVILPRVKCPNPLCPAVRKNKCKRSTHVVYPESIMPFRRYSVPEMLLCILFKLSINRVFIQKILEQLRDGNLTATHDVSNYFYRYHKNEVLSWAEHYHVAWKRKYLHICLFCQDVFRVAKLFARFWILRYHQCWHVFFYRKYSGTYFCNTINQALYTMQSHTGSPP